MKNRVFLLPIAVAAIGAACASSRGTHGPTEDVLTAEDVERRPHESVEMMLQRKFPGVQVVKNSAGQIMLQIRGASTILGEPKPPLIVVNDMEMEPDGQGLTSLVNPYDIESIRVLKGPETAIYGIRGADGVIVIRTKGAGKAR